MLHGILGQRCALIPGLERHRISQRAFGNNDSGGMRGCMTRHALNLHRHIQQAPGLRMGLVQHLQIRTALQGTGNANPQLSRDQLRCLVHLIVRQIQRPADIADSRPCSHRPEGDDLCHMLLAVFVNNVSNHLVAALVAEVDINIRHRYPFRIKETLKKQIVLQRVHIRDPQGIRSETACRGTAAWAGRNALAVAIGNEIPDDQKVIAEAHALDNTQLIGQPVLGCRLLLGRCPERRIRIPRFKPVAAELPQVSGCIQPFRKRGILRENMLAERQPQIAFLGDFQRVTNRLGHMRKQRCHLLAALEEQLVRSDLQPLLIIHRLAGADADQHILNLGILLGQIVNVIRNHQLNIAFRRQSNQLRIDALLFRNAVILQLQIEVLAKYLLIPLRRFICLIITPVQQMLGYLTAQTGTKADNALGVSRQSFHINARLIVLALEMADRNQPHQVFVAGFILREQDQMVNRLIFAAAALTA